MPPISTKRSALVGAIAHELVHGFGLRHCAEGEQLAPFGESLMGSSNYTWREERRGAGRGSFLLDNDAMQLIAWPPFTTRTAAGRSGPAPSRSTTKAGWT